MTGPLSVVDTVVTKTATAATYGGSGTAIFGGINANWVAAVGGVLIGIAGLLVNWYFRYQHLKLAREKASQWSPLGDE